MTSEWNTVQTTTMSSFVYTLLLETDILLPCPDWLTCKYLWVCISRWHYFVCASESVHPTPDSSLGVVTVSQPTPKCLLHYKLDSELSGNVFLLIHSIPFIGTCPFLLTGSRSDPSLHPSNYWVLTHIMSPSYIFGLLIGVPILVYILRPYLWVVLLISLNMSFFLFLDSLPIVSELIFRKVKSLRSD